MRALIVVILFLFNPWTAHAQELSTPPTPSITKETYSETPPEKAWSAPMTKTQYSSKLYRMVCDLTGKTAPFTQTKAAPPCAMLTADNAEFIVANMPKPCDHPTRGAKLREFIGGLCDSMDQLKIQEYFFYRTATCNAYDKVEEYIGGQKCLSSYRVITPCKPHTHKDGTFHDCKDPMKGH